MNRTGKMPSCVICVWGLAGFCARVRRSDGKHKLRCRSGRRLEVGLPVGVSLLAHQIVRSALENLRGQIPVLLVTKWANGHEGFKRKLLYLHRHIPAASFALNDELLSFLNPKAHHVGSRPQRGVKPEPSKRLDEVSHFKGNEFRDGHGHVAEGKGKH